jgi:predicted nucleotidyltransferase
MNDNNNIARIKAVYRALEELGKSVVFVGGATVSLYKDRPASETRVTDDVDIVVELLQYVDYANIEEQLRKKGFVNDVESGVICRYRINGIIVDVMPTNENILGFNNRWYTEGFQNSIEYSLEENENVRIFNSIYFIASKLDAFNDRGNNDGRTSSDFEDIVYVLNNRTVIWKEMKNAPETVKIFLKTEFKKLVEQDYIHEWLSSHLEYYEQRRVNYIFGGLVDFIRQ